MLKKMLVSLFVISLYSQIFASTPVGQGSEFPSEPTSQKQLHEKYKQATKPVRTFSPQPFPGLRAPRVTQPAPTASAPRAQ